MPSQLGQNDSPRSIRRCEGGGNFDMCNISRREHRVRSSSWLKDWFGLVDFVWWTGSIDGHNIRDGERGVAGGLSQARRLSNEYGDRLLSST